MLIYGLAGVDSYDGMNGAKAFDDTVTNIGFGGAHLYPIGLSWLLITGSNTHSIPATESGQRKRCIFLVCINELPRTELPAADESGTVL